MDSFSNIYNLKENIMNNLKKVNTVQEAQKFNKDINNFMELIIFSLIAQKDNFFGNITVQLVREIDYMLPENAGVYYKDYAFHLVFNPYILFQNSIPEIQAVLIHECYHILNNHIARSRSFINKASSTEINLAADTAINQFISNLPKGAITLSSFCRFYGISEYSTLPEQNFEYYLTLAQQSKNTSASSKNNESETSETMQKKTSNSNSKNTIDETDKNEPKNNSFKNNAKSNTTEKNNLNNSSKKTEQKIAKDIRGGHDIWNKSDSSNGLEDLKNVVKEIADNALLVSKGDIPEHIENIIKNLNQKPFISWQKLLKKYTGRLPKPYKKISTRLNRRQPERTDLRGHLSSHECEITVAVDTSGSITEDDLKYAFNEIFAILKDRKSKITVIECDCEITNIYEALSPKDINLKVNGRGGTLFSPVFKYLKENPKYKNSLLIYFTDGYGERKLSVKPEHYKTLWVTINNDEYFSLTNPYGEVKPLYSVNPK